MLLSSCLLCRLNSGWPTSNLLASGYLPASSLSDSHSVFSAKPHTLWCYYHGLTLPPLVTLTVDTTYCNVVPNVCHKTNQFTLCDIGIQRSSIWGLGSIGGNVDEIEISTASIAQCPAQSHIHSPASISREVNAGKSGDRGWT